MKNFLSTDNFISSSPEFLNQIIQSSSEMEGCPITNILESEDKTIWLSTEELPQEITINISKQFFKEFPKKISAIGIYCWHAYPTNPKLIEVQISKNKDKKSFISLGNFDLCLKPGRQLLQLDDELDYITTKDTNSNDLIITLIIKETFGDKRTYINNIYLYEDINMCGKKFLTSMEPIKEEDSNSMIYLRESRERTLPKSAIKSKKKSVIDKNSILKGLLEIDFDAKSEEFYKNNKNENKFFSGIESEFMMSDSELSEKFHNINNNNIVNNKDKDNDNENDFFNDKKKDDDINSLNKTGNKNESTNNSNNNELINKMSNKDLKDSNNNKNNNNIKNNDRYFIEKNKNDNNTKNNNNNNKIIINKEESHDVEDNEKSLNINDFNDDEENENENGNINNTNNNNNNKIINNNNNNDVQINDNNNNSQNYIEKEIDEQSNNSYKEEDLILLIDEFENYKKNQIQKVKNYEKKINYLENQFKEMTLLSNRMKNNINKILQNQMKQKRLNQDYLLNNMRKMINERITKVFSNFQKFSNFYRPPPPPLYTMENDYFNPNYHSNYNYNYNNTYGNTNYGDMSMNYYGDNTNIKKSRIKSEKKKSKKNIITERNRSGQKIPHRINSNNEYNKTEYSSKNYINNKDSFIRDNSNNLLDGEFDQDNYLGDYYLKNGFYQENNTQNQRNMFDGNYNSNSYYLNNRKTYNNRLNIDNDNEFIINNRTERINNKGRLSTNQNHKKQYKNSQEDFSSTNNEIEELFDEFRNNLGEKDSETIIKSSISKKENYMKGNLNEVKNVFQNKDKNQNQNNIKKQNKIKEKRR